MASVVIIHAAENALPARALADKLRGMRLTPVIELPPGDALRQAVIEAAAVIALWSPQSAEQPAIVEEADSARGTGKLVNARMQNTQPPSQFRSTPTIDLTGWRGEDTFPGWRALADEIAKKTGANVPPPAPPVPPPGGFFQPGPASTPPPRSAPRLVEPAPPPRPRAASYPTAAPIDDEPPKKGANLAVIGIVTFLVVAGVAVGGYFLYDRLQSSSAASATWEALDKNDAGALRAFIESGNVGDFGDEAETALAALEVQRLEEARATDTIPSLEAFLRDFPESRHAIEVNGRIAELRAAPPAVPDAAEALPIDPNAAPPADGAPLAPPERAAPLPPGDGPAPLTPPPADPAPEPVPLQ